MTSYKVKVNEVERIVIVQSRTANNIELLVDDQTFTVQIEPTIDGAADAGGTQTATHEDSTVIVAPIPGIIHSVDVKPGDSVEVGQTVVVIEAMKMQNNIPAPRTGVIGAVKVNEGDEVDAEQVIATFAN